MTLLDAVSFPSAARFPGADRRAGASVSRMGALVISLLIFVVSLGLIGTVTDAAGGYSFVHNSQWINYPSIKYHVGMDGLSLWLVILTTLLTPIAVLVSWKHIDHRVKAFYAFLILLEFGLIGVFVSLDLFLFYVFWEVSLVPMYFLIGIWGHDRRIYAAVKFFLYTIAGSVLMLGAIIYLYNLSGTFDYTSILEQLRSGRIMLSDRAEMAAVPGVLPRFCDQGSPVPAAHLAARRARRSAHGRLHHAGQRHAEDGNVRTGSLLPASVPAGRAQIGARGWPRSRSSASSMARWSRMVQPNMKKLVAYSSVSHLGFVVLGIFSFTQAGLDGAVYQMLNHGISTGALFMLVGYLYERRHSLEISAYGGVATPAPNLAAVFLITTLASIGLPMLNGFIGEYLVLQGASQANFTWSVFAALGVILSACYMLWLYQRTFFGRASESLSHHMPDLNMREWAAVLPLLLLMFWMGIYSQSFMPAISTQNAQILQQVNQRRYGLTSHGGEGGGQCPLTPSPRASNTSASCRKSC